MDKNPRPQTGTTRSKRRQLSNFPTSQLPLASCDNLSKIRLTKSALRELNQRNRQHNKRLSFPRTRRPVTRNFLATWRRDHRSASDILGSRTTEDSRDIEQLAVQGSPDISSLRGYLEPIHPLDSTITPTCTTNTSRSRSARPYDRICPQALIDRGMFHHRYRFPDGRAPPKPSNWDDMNERMLQHRASLSSSQFSDGAHDEFVQADADAKKEDQVAKFVIPIIAGKTQDASCASGNIPFRNRDPLTDDNLVPGHPDLYYGARPEQLNRRAREDLSNQIIPSTQIDLPIAPNFFLTIKGPDGAPAIAKQQALYDATFGERGQVSLESWGQDGTVSDNKAHTITSSYQDGQLKIYSVHAAQPNGTNNSRPEYYMHQISAHAMTNNREIFREGASAFRNLRDYAEEQRNGAIQRANERAKKIEADGLDDVDNGELQTAFGSARDTSSIISRALDDEQDSEKSIEDVYVPPPANQAAPQPRRNPRRKVRTDKFSS